MRISEGRRRALELEAVFKGASRRAWLAVAAAELAMERYRDDPLVDFALREAQAAWDALTTVNMDAREFLAEYA